MIFAKLFKEGRKVTNGSNPFVRALYSTYLFNGMPINSFSNFNADLDLGFMDNEIVYAIVNKIAKTASTVPLKLYDNKGNEVLNHWSLGVIHNPNDDMILSELLYAMYVYYLSVGNSYLYSPIVQYANERLTNEMWVMPAPYVIAVSGGVTNPIKGYKLYIGNQEIVLKKKQVMHLKMFNPKFQNGNFVYGLSPISVASQIIQGLNAGEKRMEKMLVDGIPPFVMSAMSSDGLTEQQQEMLEKVYAEKYLHSDTPNKPLISGVQLKVDKLGFSATDLSIISHSEHGLRVLCDVYGVKSVLFNDNSNSTYNNVKEAEVDFYNNTIKPLNNYFAKKLTSFLLSGTGYEYRFDYSEISVLGEYKAELMLKYNGINFLTDNEKRELFSYEPLNELNNSNDEKN